MTVPIVLATARVDGVFYTIHEGDDPGVAVIHRTVGVGELRIHDAFTIPRLLLEEYAQQGKVQKILFSSMYGKMGGEGKVEFRRKELARTLGGDGNMYTLYEEGELWTVVRAEPYGVVTHTFEIPRELFIGKGDKLGDEMGLRITQEVSDPSGPGWFASDDSLARLAALETEAASKHKLLMVRDEQVSFVDKNCQACKHCFMEPDSDFVCGHPDAGPLGSYIRNAADFGGHCGPERPKFEQHPNRWPNGDLK